jgi:hypothetical protein
MSKIYERIMQVRSGRWEIGIIEDHSARPLTESEMQEALDTLNLRASPPPAYVRPAPAEGLLREAIMHHREAMKTSTHPDGSKVDEMEEDEKLYAALSPAPPPAFDVESPSPGNKALQDAFFEGFCYAEDVGHTTTKKVVTEAERRYPPAPSSQGVQEALMSAIARVRGQAEGGRGVKHHQDEKGIVRFEYKWSLERRIDEAIKAVCEMASKGRGPRMSIPAGDMLERGGDEDILIVDALRECKDLMFPADPQSTELPQGEAGA